MDIISARVMSQNAPARQLTVMTALSSELLTVRVLHYGPFDGLRVKQTQLPGRGTMGVVLFPYSDMRNGIWLGAISQNLVDAVTSDDGAYFDDYEAHWSGFWKLLQQTGELTTVFPDGSEVLVGNTTAPTTYHHTVNPQNQQERVALTQAERVPTPPAAFPMTVNHASGTVIQIDANGNATINAGSASVTISGGTINLDTANLMINGTNFITLFNQHVHPDPEGGDTGAPTSDIPT
jgi:phage baseplate assembly protein gpV